MSIAIVALLVIIVAELGVVIYFIGGGGGLPWMVKADSGSLSGKIASPRYHRTLNAKLEYLMCFSRFQAELEDQRFRASQGLDPAPKEALDYNATPATIKAMGD